MPADHAAGRGQNVVVMLHEWLDDSRSHDAMLPYLSHYDFTWRLPGQRGSWRHLDFKATRAEGFREADIRASLGPTVSKSAFEVIQKAGPYPMQEAPVRFAAQPGVPRVIVSPSLRPKDGMSCLPN